MEISLTGKGLILMEGATSVEGFDRTRELLNAYEKEYSRLVFDLMLKNQTPAEALAKIKEWAENK